MGSRIECFFIEPAPLAQESVRRFVFSDVGKCRGRFGYHNAELVVGEVQWHEDFGGRGEPPSEEEKRVLQWPKACDCGYAFQDTDQWQHNFDQKYRRRGGSDL